MIALKPCHLLTDDFGGEKTCFFLKDKHTFNPTQQIQYTMDKNPITRGQDLCLLQCVVCALIQKWCIFSVDQ